MPIPAIRAANPMATPIPVAARGMPEPIATGMKARAPKPHSQFGMVMVVVSRRAAMITSIGKTPLMSTCRRGAICGRLMGNSDAAMSGTAF